MRQIFGRINHWLTAFGPSYIAPALLKSEIPISIDGVRLHAAGVPAPTLRVGEKEFEHSTWTDTRVEFTVPRSVFPKLEQGTAFQQADLTLYLPFRAWVPWNWWKFWKWRSVEPIPFRMMFVVVPETLGSYYSAQEVDVPREVRQAYVRDVDAHAYGGTDPRKECFSPDQGYDFDLGTVERTMTDRRARKDDDYSAGTNVATVRAVPDEIETKKHVCILVVASVGCTECEGWTTGRLQVDEVKTEWDRTTFIPVTPQMLDWKHDGEVTLLTDPVSQIITVDMFGEIERKFTSTAPVSFQFIDVVPDPPNKVLFLRPKFKEN